MCKEPEVCDATNLDGTQSTKSSVSHHFVERPGKQVGNLSTNDYLGRGEDEGLALGIRVQLKNQGLGSTRVWGQAGDAGLEGLTLDCRCRL